MNYLRCITYIFTLAIMAGCNYKNDTAYKCKGMLEQEFASTSRHPELIDCIFLASITGCGEAKEEPFEFTFLLKKNRTFELSSADNLYFLKDKKLKFISENDSEIKFNVEEKTIEKNETLKKTYISNYEAELIFNRDFPIGIDA